MLPPLIEKSVELLLPRLKNGQAIPVNLRAAGPDHFVIICTDRTPFTKELCDELKKALPEVRGFLIMKPGDSFELVNETWMNRAGWFRKRQTPGGYRKGKDPIEGPEIPDQSEGPQPETSTSDPQAISHVGTQS